MLPVIGQQKLAYTFSWNEQDNFTKELPRHTADAVLFYVNISLRESELVQLRRDWEFKVNGYSVFILPDNVTNNNEERIVVCNSIAQSVLEARRGIHPTYMYSLTTETLLETIILPHGLKPGNERDFPQTTSS